MNSYSNPSTRYLETSVHTSNPFQLVAMLYDGAIRFLRQAAGAIKSGDVQAKWKDTDRALAIIQQLQASLDMNRGQQVAAELDGLYSYMTRRIMEGSARLDAKPLEEVTKLLTTLKGAWDEVATREAAPVNAVASAPANGRVEIRG